MLKTLKWRVLVRAFRDSFFHCDVQGAVGAVRDGLADAVDLRLGCCKKTTMVNGSKNWWKEISFFAGCSFLGKKIWHERLCLYLFVYIYIYVLYIYTIYTEYSMNPTPESALEFRVTYWEWDLCTYVEISLVMSPQLKRANRPTMSQQLELF